MEREKIATDPFGRNDFSVDIDDGLFIIWTLIWHYDANKLDIYEMRHVDIPLFLLCLSLTLPSAHRPVGIGLKFLMIYLQLISFLRC